MACNCNRVPCGCKDKAFTTIPSFESGNCLTPQTCSEFTDANCVIYTGYGILDLRLDTGDQLNNIIQKLVLLATNPDCMDPDSNCLSIDDLGILSRISTTITPFWSLVTTAINYQVEYKQELSNTWILNPVVGPNATQDTITGLVPDTTYHIRVNAFCSSGNCYSVTLVVKTLA